ncbi:hypothetical protein ACFXPW_23840 [Streptomyces goshikiensis]|uniref:hypothetical protein n=1 Tax=Streptomyces goshikiensis TaxID=1942 RepID=UPI003695A33E
MAFGCYHVVLARGLTPDELAARLAAAVDGAECGVTAVGKHTGDTLLELIEDTYGDTFAAIGLRLGRAGAWTYAVARTSTTAVC